jgi:hypothetical protein
VGYDRYTCSCGQRFRLPRTGRLRFLPEEDLESLFWVPGTISFVPLEAVLALPELQGIDREATFVELPTERLQAAADLAMRHGMKPATWRGRRQA